jgi:integrase
VVAERLGHASPVVTMNTYAQVTRKQSRQAADVFAAKLLSDGG